MSNCVRREQGGGVRRDEIKRREEKEGWKGTPCVSLNFP